MERSPTSIPVFIYCKIEPNLEFVVFVDHSGSRSHEDFKRFITEKKNEETFEKVTLDLNLDNEDYGPMTITEDNFGKTIKKGVTFIKFWVPWCKHCKQLKPIWDSLSTKFFGNNDVKIAHVDCAQYDSLCSKEQVRYHSIDCIFFQKIILIFASN